VTGRDLVTAAFLEPNILGAGEVLTPEDLDFGLSKLNRLIDNWNAEREAAYCNVFTPFTLTPALSPHTIGPAGTWVTPQRPVTIESLELVLTGGTRVPITLRDRDWYAALSVPAFSNAYPLDCHYEPDWPTGKLYFYPVPSAALQVIVGVRQVLGGFTADTVFSLPVGYQDALILTLCEDLATAYPGAVITPKLEAKATAARARIFANNTGAPRLMTRDAGMPGGRGAGGTYLTGWMG